MSSRNLTFRPYVSRGRATSGKPRCDGAIPTDPFQEAKFHRILWKHIHVYAVEKG